MGGNTLSSFLQKEGKEETLEMLGNKLHWPIEYSGTRNHVVSQVNCEDVETVVPQNMEDKMKKAK